MHRDLFLNVDPNSRIARDSFGLFSLVEMIGSFFGKRDTCYDVVVDVEDVRQLHWIRYVYGGSVFRVL